MSSHVWPGGCDAVYRYLDWSVDATLYQTEGWPHPIIFFILSLGYSEEMLCNFLSAVPRCFDIHSFLESYAADLTKIVVDYRQLHTHVSEESEEKEWVMSKIGKELR